MLLARWDDVEGHDVVVEVRRGLERWKVQASNGMRSAADQTTR